MRLEQKNQLHKSNINVIIDWFLCQLVSETLYKVKKINECGISSEEPYVV